jgi:hypothetical protein
MKEIALHQHHHAVLKQESFLLMLETIENHAAFVRSFGPFTYPCIRDISP